MLFPLCVNQLFVFIETVIYQLFKCIQAFICITAISMDGYGRAFTGGQHHNPHNTLGVYPSRVLLNIYIAVKTGGEFYKFGEVALFLAYRDGRPVGRVSAHVNRRHDEQFDDRKGFFGFFDCEDDPEAAQALFASAEAFHSVVIEGSMVDRGMAGWGEVLSGDDAEAIRAFIVFMANQ